MMWNSAGVTHGVNGAMGIRPVFIFYKDFTIAKHISRLKPAM
jgi:hypothetical protein